MTRAVVHLTGALWLVTMVAHPAVAQTEREAPCRARYDRSLTIGPLTNTSFNAYTTASEWSPRGYLVGRTFTEAELVLADSTGRILRQWGRAGDGPGETRVIVAHAWLDSSRYIVADRDRRFTVFDIDTGYVRSFRLGIPGTVGGDLIRLGPNLLAARVAFSLEPGQLDPIVLFDATGRTVARIGFAERGIRWFHGDERGVWFTDRPGEVINFRPLRSPLAARSLTIQRPRPDHLQEHSRFSVSDLKLDTRGRLWLLGYWKTQPVLPRGYGADSWTWLRSQGIDPLSPDYIAQTRDPTLEIIDAATGRLLVQQPLPKGFLPRVLLDGSVVEVREQPDGEIVVLLHHVQLSCPDGGER